MGIIGFIVAGLIIGAIARLLRPGRQNLGWGATLLIGLAGSVVGGVIANLLKSGKGLRDVQYFAGHKKISSTEKYRQTGLEELKAAILKYHPLQ